MWLKKYLTTTKNCVEGWPSREEKRNKHKRGHGNGDGSRKVGQAESPGVHDDSVITNTFWKVSPTPSV